MSEMIYDFAIHSLYYDKTDMIVHNFSLMIDTLELVFHLQTGKLVGIQGFFPLVSANECNIELPDWKEGSFTLQNCELSKCKHNEIYDLAQVIPRAQKYFEKRKVKYDKREGIIQLGEELQKGESVIKISSNIFCGFDSNSVLKCLYIVPMKLHNKTLGNSIIF